MLITAAAVPTVAGASVARRSNVAMPFCGVSWGGGRLTRPPAVTMLSESHVHATDETPPRRAVKFKFGADRNAFKRLGEVEGAHELAHLDAVFLSCQSETPNASSAPPDKIRAPRAAMATAASSWTAKVLTGWRRKSTIYGVTARESMGSGRRLRRCRMRRQGRSRRRRRPGRRSSREGHGRALKGL
jgi:hypothetical protein